MELGRGAPELRMVKHLGIIGSITFDFRLTDRRSNGYDLYKAPAGHWTLLRVSTSARLLPTDVATKVSDRRLTRLRATISLVRASSRPC